MHIAVIADTHIPDCDHSSEEAALRWAVRTCQIHGPDVVVFAGDLTASGQASELRRCRAALSGLRVPMVSTPGNSDLRTPEHAETLRQALSSPASASRRGIAVLGVDSADGRVLQPERERFAATLLSVPADVPLVIVTHWSPVELPEDDRQWLTTVLSERRVEVILAGHKHLDADLSLGDIPVFLGRGLDPEKAKGGAPAVALFTRSQGAWIRTELPWPAADPRRWPEAGRREFLDSLGISTMGRTLEDTRAAAAARVPVLELRAEPSLGVCRDELEDAVRVWRRRGGRELSMHLPDLCWKAAAGTVTGRRRLRQAVALASYLGVQRVTAHVPRATVTEMAPDGPARDAMLVAFAAELGPLVDRGIVLGIENLHRNPGEATDGHRGFGYTPPECLAWIKALAARLPFGIIGLLLDLGHARNNAPFSQRWTLGRWLAEAGPCIVGYHLHQVTAEGNHQPLHDPFGPTISMSALFWGWRTGTAARAPMFLEIRDETGLTSLGGIRRFLDAEPNAQRH